VSVANSNMISIHWYAVVRSVSKCFVILPFVWSVVRYRELGGWYVLLV